MESYSLWFWVEICFEDRPGVDVFICDTDDAEVG